ncbi:cupin domain-containing protein [Ruegeria sp. HKCCD7255]|uniref:cupin domain-containing protein n=1 Tax=Ruegeria sp. HKCCD7255 TaxID=2683004 RepID=UPI0014899AC9
MSETYYLMGMIMDFHTSSEEDGYFLCTATLSSGAGAPPNRHPNDQESFFVQKGLVEFTVDGETIHAKPGQFVKVPRGEIHSFRNPTDEEAEMLILNVPGSIHENVFRICGTKLSPGSRDWPSPEPDLDMDWVAKICADEGLEIVS